MPQVLQRISLVEKGKHEGPRERWELFRELALLQVPWEALGTGFCSLQNVSLVWKKARTVALSAVRAR
jgi:hypothetical protein